MNDYMSTAEELKKQPEALEAVQEMAAGQPEVFAIMWSFWNFAHAWDDLIDESGWEQERKERAQKALHDFTVDLLLNPFVRAHAAEVRGMFVMALCRQLDGDSMADSPKAEERALAPAVRCADVDVLLHLAYLAGGWERLRQFGPLRDYDKADLATKDHKEHKGPFSAPAYAVPVNSAGAQESGQPHSLTH